MNREILAYLRHVPRADTRQIVEDMRAMGNERATLKRVQKALHEMDDKGDVLMRGGWYRISEKARLECG